MTLCVSEFIVKIRIGLRSTRWRYARPQYDWWALVGFFETGYVFFCTSRGGAQAYTPGAPAGGLPQHPVRAARD